MRRIQFKEEREVSEREDTQRGLIEEYDHYGRRRFTVQQSLSAMD